MKKIILPFLALLMVVGAFAVPAAAAGPDDWGRPKLELRAQAPDTAGYTVQMRNSYTNTPFGAVTRAARSNGSFTEPGWFSLVTNTFTKDSSQPFFFAEPGAPWVDGHTLKCNHNGVIREFFSTGAYEDNNFGNLATGYIFKQGNPTQSAPAYMSLINLTCGIMSGHSFTDANEIYL